MHPDQPAGIVIDVESPPPTFGTLPGIASLNGVYADHTCGEEDGRHHRKYKGESLDGIEGWEADHADSGEWWQANEDTGEQL